MTENGTRRDFLVACALGSATTLAGCSMVNRAEDRGSPSVTDEGGDDQRFPAALEPSKKSAGARRVSESSLLDGADTYAVESTEDSLHYDIPDGTLEDARYVTFDLVARGETLPTFRLELHEGDSDRTFALYFGVLTECSARVRLPLSATDLSTWLLQREGGWLKPYVAGDRVRLSEVESAELAVVRKDEGTLRWDQTALWLREAEPSRLSSPALPEGSLLDEFGQSTIHEWEGKTESEQELVDRLWRQLESASNAEWPGSFSRWGGWTERRFESTGFFRTHHDGDRWWLVDPDGHPFWSAGINQVQPRIDTGYEGIEDALEWWPDDDELYDEREETAVVNFLGSNLDRAFEDDSWREQWLDIAVGELLDYGFNTVGNWSEWHQTGDSTLPYVRQLDLEFSETPFVYRDFPDVFHPAFEREAAEAAKQLRETAEDPALVGYFLENEPKWSFSEGVPAVEMLYTTETSETRRALADFLREWYGSNETLRDAWGFETTFDEVESGRWSRQLTDAARADLRTFSTRMVEQLYDTISEKCRAVDSNHLNLGVRFNDVPPAWTLSGLYSIDVFSLNWYGPTPPDEEIDPVLTELDVPVLIGEWHVGATDVGLPGSGLVRVGSQRARGDAYRAYFEQAASRPWCVGAHYYALYDQSALGRYDGENYNIGFLDVGHRRYEHLVEGARTSHERLYDVATWNEPAYPEAPDYVHPLY